uniref:Uncharacterized protein n=1 Tax=Lepeophtheirus salmonis TaxID=72036 RepID=A0A0K2T5V1_LEPSM
MKWNIIDNREASILKEVNFNQGMKGNLNERHLLKIRIENGSE